MGTDAQRFPATRWSAIRASADANPETRRAGYARLVAAYWRPVYVYLRLRHRKTEADARDLTQAFFAQWWEQGTAGSYDAERARFRTFVRTCLDRYVIDQHRADGARKRGGGAITIDLDVAQLERDAALIEPAIAANPEALFDAEWSRSLLQRGLDDLRANYASQSRDLDLALFDRYELAQETRPTYAELAAEFGVPVTTITNRLAAVRRDLRTRLAARLRELTSTEDEFREESQRLFGVMPK